MAARNAHLVLFVAILGLSQVAQTAIAQAQPAQEEAQEDAPFTLDLPEWDPDPEDLPPELRPLDVVRPELPEEAAAEAAELEARIAEIEGSWLDAETRQAQDALFEEAIGLSERVLAIRMEHQGNTDDVVRWRNAAGEPSEWHEVADAGRTVEDLRLLLGLDAEGRAALASIAGTHAEYERLWADGRYAEAGAVIERQLAVRRRVLGDDHPFTLTSISDMGALLDSQGRLTEAEPYLREALEARRRTLGDAHLHTLVSINDIGGLLWRQGRLAEAEPYFREALEGSRRTLGDEHQATLTSISYMGALLQSQGRLAEAEPYFRESLENSRRTLGDEHRHTLSSISNMGVLLLYQGKLAEAEPYYREALEARRRMLGDEHPHTLFSISNMGSLLQSQGRLAEAEPYLREALATAERLRVDVAGGASARAQFAGALGLPGIASGYSRTLLGLGRAGEALAALERGRGRAGLDLFAGGRTEAERLLRAAGDADRLVRYDAALAVEEEARLALVEAEARLSAAPDEQKAEWTQRVQDVRRTLSEKTASVFAELRGLVPAVNPLSTEQMLAALAPGEALVTWSWTNDGVIALVARDGEVRGVTLAKDTDETERRSAAITALRERIAARPVGGDSLDDGALADARAAAAPEELRGLLAGAASIIAVPDGPLSGVPVELLLPKAPVASAPTATIALRPRLNGESPDARYASAGLVVGDPVFAGFEREDPDYPDAGVLIAMVTEGSNAAVAGLRRGDVLLAYAEHELGSAQDLGPAIGATAEALATRGASEHDRPVNARVWRLGDDGRGEKLEVALAPGRMGVQLSQAPPADGLRSMATLDRSADELAAGATALEQIRFYGGALRPLPATRLEAEAIAAMLGSETTLLLGDEATAPRLREAVEARPARVIHLATHGLLGSSNRPLLASLALTTPDEPTREDNGFVTLGDILSTWGGQLRQTELVALSACDTGRGVRQGGTMMALPLGLLIAGADTVVASLWKVDDKATALLMARFYANWLGKTKTAREIDGVVYAPGEAMPKLAALREAQRWLRSLTREQANAMTGTPDAVNESVTRDPSPRRGRLVTTPDPDARPYDHPFYWSAFVLYGSPK